MCQMYKMRKLSIPFIILTVLREIGAITIDAFFNPAYAKRYGYTPTNFSMASKSCSSYYTSISRLKKRELIKKKGDIYYLTDKGEKESFLCRLKELRSNYVSKNNKNQKWDKKWRIVFFDIPEKKRRYRDELRLLLKAVGFKKFQKSTWVYPYKVPDFLKEILFEENIKHYARLITTLSIEYDADIRKKFHLT